MAVKAVIGLLGLSAIGVTGLAIAKPELVGLDYMPSYHFLALDKDYKKAYSKDEKFGGKHGRYLVGATRKADETSDNESWWEWTFRNLTNNKPLSSKFSSVTKGYSDNKKETTALNQLCREAYGKQDSDFTIETRSDQDKFKESEVWKFCSPIGQKPTTVKEYDNNVPGKERYKSTEKSKKIGKEAENELISVFDSGNDAFWEIRNKEFQSSKLTVDSKYKFFEKGKKDSKHIKSLCRFAYTYIQETKKAEEPEITVNEAKKFCSLNELTNSKDN